MPVQKKRRSIAKRKQKVATYKVAVKDRSKCSNCGEAVMPHQVCGNCGFYKGKKVLVTKAEKRAERKAKKSKEEK